MIFWTKTVLDKGGPFPPITFNTLIMKEYRKLYYEKKDTDNKETNKIVTKPERFTEKTRFPKWLRQLYNYSI